MIRGGCVLSCSLKHGVDRTVYGILLEGELVGALIPSVNEHFNTCKSVCQIWSLYENIFRKSVLKKNEVLDAI